MRRRYKDEGCAKDYPVRTKCIALFQKIHGADTLLFAMYVYEYGHECPAPNRRRVYISYLDSVQYFEPKCYRTLAYHTVLVEYLRYVKARGFHTAHFWSCPPTPGDDYIFHVHPSHQLVPREDMLRAWYYKMLDRAKADGIVIRTTNLYDEYFVKGGVDSMPWATGRPTCLPYFEGDYIPGEIETIIKTEQEKKISVFSETREEDTVMARLGLNLRKMKDNFIVVHLRSRRFAAAVESGDDVSEFKDDSVEELVRSKRAKISGKDTGSLCIETDVLDQAGSITLKKESKAITKDPIGAPSSGVEKTDQVGSESPENDLAAQAILNADIGASLSGDKQGKGKSGSESPENDLVAQTITRANINAVSSGHEQGERNSELQRDEVGNLVQVPDHDGACVTTETSRSPRTQFQDEKASHATQAPDRTSSILENSNVLTTDMESSNENHGQLVETNKTLEAEEMPAASSGYDAGNSQEKRTSLEGERVETKTVDKADDAGSTIIASASAKMDEDDEHVNRTSVDAQSQFEREFPSRNMDSGPQATHDGQADTQNIPSENDEEDCSDPQTNQELINDSASIDRMNTGDTRFEGNTKETESKQGTEDVDHQALTLQPKIDECDPKTIEAKDVLSKTCSNDKETLPPRPTDTNKGPFNDEANREPVNKDARTDDLEGQNEVDDNDESSKGGSLITTTVKEIKDDSLVDAAVDIKGDVESGIDSPATGEVDSQTNGPEAIKCVAANASSPGESNFPSQTSTDAIHSDTKSPSNTVEENDDDGSVKASIVPAIPAREAVSTTEQVTEVDNENRTSTSEVALENMADEHDVVMSESNAVASNDQEKVFSHSKFQETARQVTDAEAIEANQRLPNADKEPRESPTMIKEVEDTNVTSQAKVGETVSDRELPTPPNDVTVVENIQNPDLDATSSEPLSSSSDAVDQVPNEPSLSTGTSYQGLLKRGIEEIKPLLSRHFDEMSRPLKYVTDTADPDEPIEVELFESRQRFLNYCQSSHCQFDELRRAKHSTMMVLFQLHNPAAPLFLQQCGACYRDITHGVRYSCNNCSKFDLCEDCYKPVTSGLWTKRDSRFEHDPSHTFTPIDMEVSIDSAMSQEDRQKALKAHCALLEHAGDCPGAPACSLQNCQKMKKLFNHVRSCDIKPKSDCRICTRLVSLCAIHARTCKVADSCPVPFCDRIRDRNERLQRQQQHMDDRRRQAQNNLYHTS